MCQFSNRSQKMSKYGKNISDTLAKWLVCHFFVPTACGCHHSYRTDGLGLGLGITKKVGVGKESCKMKETLISLSNPHPKKNG